MYYIYTYIITLSKVKPEDWKGHYSYDYTHIVQWENWKQLHFCLLKNFRWACHATTISVSPFPFFLVLSELTFSAFIFNHKTGNLFYEILHIECNVIWNGWEKSYQAWNTEMDLYTIIIFGNGSWETHSLSQFQENNWEMCPQKAVNHSIPVFHVRSVI